MSRGALEDDLAGFEHVAAIGDSQGRTGVLLDQQDRQAAALEVDDGLVDVLHNQRGDAQRRLIHHQQSRPRHQSPADGQHLLLTAGERAGQLARTLLKDTKKLVHLFQGRIDLDDFNEVMSSNLVKDEADTLGGFIYNSIGRVPAVGDAVQIENLLLTVEQVTGRRIRKVRANWLPATLQKEKITHADG